jgi:hypothetical protein
MKPQPKRSRNKKRIPERRDSSWFDGFMEAVRELRKDYDPGYGEFVRSLRKTDFYSRRPISDKSE